MAPLRIRRIDLSGYLKIAACLLLAGCIGWYGLFQARNIIDGPTITLTAPATALQHEQTVQIEGSAHNITEIRLNGRPIHTDETGRFSEALVLPSGYTIMTLTAKDRYGRTRTVSRTLVYEPQPINEISITYGSKEKSY